MNIQGFKYFLVVAEEMNITKAANKLYISQQYLSAHLHRMEERYGVELFQRKPVLKLTLAGKAMVFYAKQVLTAENAMKAEFADIASNCRGHMNMGMSRQRNQVFFSNIWERYQPQHPNISVSLEETNTESLLQQLRTNQIDFCMGVNVLSSQDFDVTPLVKEQLCCSLSTELLRSFRPKTWRSDMKKFLKEGVDLLTLQDLPFYLLPHRNSLRGSLDQLFATHNFYPHVILETNNQNLMLKLADGGVGLLSPLYLYQYWQTNAICSKPPDVYPIKNKISLTTVSYVCRKGEKLPKYMEDMKKIIIEEMIHYKNVVNKINFFSFIE